MGYTKRRLLKLLELSSVDSITRDLITSTFVPMSNSSSYFFRDPKNVFICKVILFLIDFPSSDSGI